MKQRVRLFIQDCEVDLDNTPSILFDYTETEITNPTVIKNGVSKTVSIPGTAQNCNIFGNIWDLERYQQNGNTSVGANFNPSKKVDYTLYVDSEIVESGYLKLNSITRKKDIITFNTTLYSGLGDFFYSLSYNDEGEKLKLSDLTFLPSSETAYGTSYEYPEGGDDEFDMVITKDTVASAWTYLGNWMPPMSNETRKYKYINFATCYNATPSDNFSADKVLINFSGSTLSKSVSGYTDNAGFALGTLPENVDEWGVRDLRSYLQRPILRVSGMINAICRYAEQRGYTVELSPDFFNSGNPYYEQTYLTMPLLTEMDLVGADIDTAVQNVTFTRGLIHTYNGFWRRIGMIPSEELRVGSERMEVNLNLYASGTTNINQNLLTSTYVNGEKNFCAYGVQLLAFASSDITTEPIAASDMAWLTTKLPNGDYLRTNETGIGNDVFLNKDIFAAFGHFTPQGDGLFKWTSSVTLTLDSIPKNAVSFALYIASVANYTTGTSTVTGEQYSTYGTRQGRCYTSSAITEITSQNAARLYATTESVETADGAVTMKSQTAGYSGAKVGKRTLLNTEHTPAEYLISFCKCFGLHFLKNPYDKTIKILTRAEFYNDPTPIDISDLIDRSNMTINPVTFDKKYYDMYLEEVGGANGEKYKKMYSRTYGSQRIDTGYEFDTEPKDILSGNTYKTAVQSIQKSKYYVSPLGESGKTPAYIYQGFTYQLYSGTSSSSSTIDIPINDKPSDFVAIGYDKYYDSLDKPQFRTADDKAVKGENTLLFYRGKITQKNADGQNVYYNLSDDTSMMSVLNDGTPCWLYSEVTNSAAGRICVQFLNLPYFSRYITSGTDIEYSLDFGEPKQLFVNDFISKSSSTLFNKYWSSYIADMYDINNRVVTVKVQLDKRPSYELMRKFYWFDNSFWRLNRIKNYSVTSFEPTECEFIKVQNIGDYTNIFTE